MARKPEDGPCRGSRQAPVCPCDHLVTSCKTALSSVPCQAVQCGMSLRLRRLRLARNLKNLMWYYFPIHRSPIFGVTFPCVTVLRIRHVFFRTLSVLGIEDEFGILVEQYWHEKIEILEEKTVPMPLCHHKAHTDCSGVEPGPPPWNNCD